MGRATCPKCFQTKFRVEELDVEGAESRPRAIVCANCGAVLTSAEMARVERLLTQIARRLGIKPQA